MAHGKKLLAYWLVEEAMEGTSSVTWGGGKSGERGRYKGHQHSLATNLERGRTQSLT